VEDDLLHERLFRNSEKTSRAGIPCTTPSHSC
jgi:hypothetical protein